MGHKEDALPFMGENSDSLALSQREVFESSFDLSGGRPRSEVRGQGLAYNQVHALAQGPVMVAVVAKTPAAPPTASSDSAVRIVERSDASDSTDSSCLGRQAESGLSQREASDRTRPAKIIVVR